MNYLKIVELYWLLQVASYAIDYIHYANSKYLQQFFCNHVKTHTSPIILLAIGRGYIYILC